MKMTDTVVEQETLNTSDHTQQQNLQDRPAYTADLCNLDQFAQRQVR